MNILFAPSSCPAWTLTDDKIFSGSKETELSSVGSIKHFPPKTRIGSGIIQIFFKDGGNATLYYSVNQKADGEKAAQYIQSFINGEISIKTTTQNPIDKFVSMRTAKEMGDFCLHHNYAFNGGQKIYPHFEVIERNLSPNEYVQFCFVSNGVTDRRGTAVLGGLMAVAFTNKKIIYAQRRSFLGDYTKTVNYDNVNDVSSKIGWVFGEIIVDSFTEYMDFSVDKIEVEKMRKSVWEIVEDYRAQKNRVNTNQVSVADELKKFKELLDMGIVTQEEFDAKKKQLLGL